VTTADINDVTIALDEDLAGYLKRVVFSHDGNDTDYTVTVTDASGATLFSKADANALADPYSYAVSHSDTGSTEFVGVPFAGGLSVQIADANQARAFYTGDGNNVTVRLYIRESWRR
jgi:hypothetical protein